MKDIIYSKAMKSYKILERVTPLLPLIVVISDIIIFILLGIFIISLPQVPEAIVLLLIGILFTLSIILAVIGEAITDHYFNILDTYKNFFEYSQYYYQKQSLKALKKKIRKNKKYLI